MGQKVGDAAQVQTFLKFKFQRFRVKPLSQETFC